MRVSDFDLLVVPRLGGAGEDDWPSRWQARLSTARFVAPADLDERRRQPWVEAITAASRAARRPALLIGHGLGAAAIVHAGRALGESGVRGAFLVAPPDEESLALTAGPDWRPMRAALPWPSLVIASRDDPDSNYAELERLAAAWGADFVDAGLAGRLDAASGHGPWPEGLMQLAAFLKRLGADGHL